MLTDGRWMWRPLTTQPYWLAKKNKTGDTSQFCITSTILSFALHNWNVVLKVSYTTVTAKLQLKSNWTHRPLYPNIEYPTHILILELPSFRFWHFKSNSTDAQTNEFTFSCKKIFFPFHECVFHFIPFFIYLHTLQIITNRT